MKLVGCAYCGVVCLPEKVGVTLNDKDMMYLAALCPVCKKGCTWIRIVVRKEEIK